MPSLSNSIFTPESELTLSTMNITSGYLALSSAISARGLITPVDVSLCTRVTASKFPVARRSSICSGRMGEPQSTCSASTCFPQRLATSNHLSEKAPFMQLSTRLVTRLRIAPSMIPQADDVPR